MNLLEQQARNRRRTWLVMAAFVGLLLVVGAGLDSATYLSEGALVPIGSTVAVLYGGGASLYSWFRGGRAVIASTRAMPLGQRIAERPDRIEYRQLQNVVEEMAIAAGLPVPAVFVIGDDDPNALASGRDPAQASIAVTEGLLAVLSREQLQGVVAHEIAHIRNLDVRLMTVVAALVGAIALISDFAERGWRSGALGGRRSSRSRASKGGGAAGVILLAVWLVAIIVAPVVARVLAMMVSRQREFLADASAAGLTRNPAALADALEAIEARVEPTKAIHQGSAQLCIADPLGRAANQRHGWWADLFATHPPMHERIAALRAMAFQP